MWTAAWKKRGVLLLTAMVLWVGGACAYAQTADSQDPSCGPTDVAAGLCAPSSPTDGGTDTGTAGVPQQAMQGGSSQASATGATAPEAKSDTEGGKAQDATTGKPLGQSGATGASGATKGGAKNTDNSNADKGTKPVEDQDQPQTVTTPIPYQNISSLRDLYTQFAATDAKLKRFGSDTFVAGTGNAQDLPADLPAGPDYVLGPGDGVILNLWGSRTDRLDTAVDRQGQLTLPAAGPIMVNGLTIAQAQDLAQKALNRQFQDEHVEISLGHVRTVRVYVVGDVQRPGAYDVSSLSSPLNALFEAGGPTARGSLRVLVHKRGGQVVREIDLYDFLLHGVRVDDRLLPGDTLLVPPVGPQVAVSGAVRRPAIYELKGEKTLKDVVDLAGGVPVSASLKQINVERVVAHERRTMLSVKISDPGNDISRELEAFHVQDGDAVSVSQILPYNESAIYLEGHVFRPGKLSYHDGMTLSDVLHSYQDVMPEPADHGEIVRLQAPDFRPETIPFNLPDVLVGNESIPLKPFDLIRVFGRYEVDAPKVSIRGEVLRPGEYSLSRGMTVAGLIAMAGGFRRSAFRDQADLSTYQVQNGQKVLLEHRVVDLKRVSGGDKADDPTLKPGDVVSIWTLDGWQDIGASVTIRGEVVHSGSYGIVPGERLSSVLLRAGGFRAEAYPAGAVLERVQVRELGEQARREIIDRIETTPVDFKPGALDQAEQAGLMQGMQQQKEEVLASLRSHPASGRQVITIGQDISSWQNTPVDVELRAGDSIIIPKQPSFVMITGQVYNAAAITYTPGKRTEWYLRRAGGITHSGDKKAIFVIRADGSVMAGGSRWSNVLHARLQPGDTIVVPEKIIGASQIWKNVMATAQIMSSVALAATLASSL